VTDQAHRPYGLWTSPIEPASLAQALRLSDVAWDTDGQTLVWLEGRSDRGVLVCASGGQAPRDLTTTLSVRAMVGYGGGDMAVAGGYVYFVAQEGRLYRQSLASGLPTPITPQFGHMAAPTPSPDGRWLLFVHTYERTDGLAIVDTAGENWPQKLAFGQDFCMQPCWHPDSRRIAWVAWDHPSMPWDSTMLRMATLDVDNKGLPSIAEVESLRMGTSVVDRPDVAIFQPQFSPDGRSLAYISDESGWSNLYLYDLGQRTHRPLTTEPVDAGLPAWSQGLRTYGFSPNGRYLYYVRNERGFSRLCACDLHTDRTQAVPLALDGYTSLAQIAIAPQNGALTRCSTLAQCTSLAQCTQLAQCTSLAFVASSSAVDAHIISCALCPASGDTPQAQIQRPVQVYRRSASENVPNGHLASPQPVQWSAPDGTSVHGLLYPPTSPQFTSTGLPPAIIHIHGGPTSQARASYNARAQFFATRGYAFLEVNYRGSTGYGKPYMAALRGTWGLLDVEDAIGGARYLVDANLADPNRLVIMGGSAGGYTVLKSLVDHPGFFKAAICLYGVSNMFTLAADTHKFEERYLDSMLGPLPEAGAIYRQRSPAFFADRIVDPIAIFQGEIDRVVPKAQSDAIVASLQQRGIPHEYHVYAGEGHGWRKQETIEAFYRAVEAFLKQYVIFA